MRVGDEEFLAAQLVALAALRGLEFDSARVETAGGFGNRKRRDEFARGHLGQELALLRVGTAFDKRRHAKHRGREKRSGNERLARFFRDYRHVQKSPGLSAV